jgi:RING finger protein 170
METEQEEVATTKKIFIFGIEAVLALTFGTFLLILHAVIIIKTKAIEKIVHKLATIFPFLKRLGFGNEKPPEQVVRINADSCCICFGEINREVNATCGHIFCGKCLVDFWESKNKIKLKCPLCRRDINMIIVNFSPYEASYGDPVTRKVIQSIKYYNICFSNQHRTMLQVVLDSPYLMRRLIFSLATKEGFTFFLKRILGSMYIIALVVYIVSPLDLIPDYIMILGWVDDAIAVIYLIMYVTILYYNFLRERN